MTETRADDLDIDRLAELANLPLDDEEAQRLSEASQQVLEEFALPEVEPGTEPDQRSRWIEDDPAPWDAEAVDAILGEVPRRDGRYIRG